MQDEFSFHEEEMTRNSQGMTKVLQIQSQRAVKPITFREPSANIFPLEYCEKCNSYINIM
jgi:hypothetical protein